MNLHFIGILLAILRSVSVIAWTGSIVFFLIVIVPVIAAMGGEVRVSTNARVYRLSKTYLRVWGLLTVVLGIAIYFFPVGNLMADLKRFDPLNIFFVQAATLIAYFVVGEGYLFRTMGMYTAITDSLSDKSKNQPLAHLVLLEKKVSNIMIVQLALLIAVSTASIYFPLTYIVP